MKRIYILLTRTNTVLARLVRKTTHSSYSHATLSLDNNFDRMYSFSRKYTNYPFIGRFMHEKLDSKLFKKYDYSFCLVYTALIQDSEYNEIENYVESIKNSKKVWRFNDIGLFSCWFNKPWKRPYKRCCSQFVGECLGNVHDLVLPRDPMAMRPTDFMNIKTVDGKEGLQLIFNGKIRDIPVPFNEDNITPIEYIPIDPKLEKKPKRAKKAKQ